MSQANALLIFLKPTCFDFLEKIVNAENAVNILELTRSLNDPEALMEQAYKIYWVSLQLLVSLKYLEYVSFRC